MSCNESEDRKGVLDRVQIAVPCPVKWNSMVGDERVKYCGQCHLNVYNIFEMTKDQAEKLIVQREGRLCVKLYRRPDGTVVTGDCSKLEKFRVKAKESLVRACIAVLSVIMACNVVKMHHTFDEAVKKAMEAVEKQLNSTSGSIAVTK